MVVAAIGVNHEQFVELAEKHFVNPVTSWESSDVIPVDRSISHYTGGDCKVSINGVLYNAWNQLSQCTHTATLTHSCMNSFTHGDIFCCSRQNQSSILVHTCCALFVTCKCSMIIGRHYFRSLLCVWV